MNEELAQARYGSGPGLLLLRARQSSCLSIEDVAAQLRLPLQIIIDIEKDDYSTMIFTFTRGYLRAYARLLNVSAEDIIDAFNNLELKETPRPQSPLTYDIGKDAKFKDRKSSSHERIVRWVSFLVIIALVVMVGLWWHNQAATPMSSAHLTDHTALSTTQIKPIPENTALVPTVTDTVSQTPVTATPATNDITQTNDNLTVPAVASEPTLAVANDTAAVGAQAMNEASDVTTTTNTITISKPKPAVKKQQTVTVPAPY